MTYALFSTHQLAQEYTDAVQAALEATNPPPPEPKKYIGKRWAEPVELDGGHYVPIFPQLPPTTHETIVTELPIIEVLE